MHRSALITASATSSLGWLMAIISLFCLPLRILIFFSAAGMASSTVGAILATRDHDTTMLVRAVADLSRQSAPALKERLRQAR